MCQEHRLGTGNPMLNRLYSRPHGKKKKENQVPTALTKKTPADETTPAPSADGGGIDFEIIELLFFAYRDFTSDPDAILEQKGFGRAHHRVIHFVNRNPGMTVADLLDTLKITKQSLARVLKQLLDGGYVRQLNGPEDRRQRRLYTTLAGKELAIALAAPQSARIARALDALPAESRKHVVGFLKGLRD